MKDASPAWNKRLMEFIQSGDHDGAQNRKRRGTQMPAAFVCDWPAGAKKKSFTSIGEGFRPSSKGKPAQRCVTYEVSRLAQDVIGECRLCPGNVVREKRQQAARPHHRVSAREDGGAFARDDR